MRVPSIIDIGSTMYQSSDITFLDRNTESLGKKNMQRRNIVFHVELKLEI